MLSFASSERLRRARRVIQVALLLPSAGLLFECGAAGDDELTWDDGFAGAASGGRPGGVVSLGSGGIAGAQGTDQQLLPFCGKGTCVPDNANSCPSLEGDPAPPPAALGGDNGLGGVPSLGGLDGFGGAGVAPQVAQACRVRHSATCSGSDCTPTRSCEAAGSGSDQAPCLTPADCAPGLTCVAEVGAGAGVCRPTCCSESACAGGAFCELRTQMGEGAEVVPVCVPAITCTLGEPDPCPADAVCSCPDGRTCAVVDETGATACVTAGELGRGEECRPQVAGECQAGFVCSADLGCIALCDPTRTEQTCLSNEICEAPAGFPPESGVCVGVGTSDPVAQ